MSIIKAIEEAYKLMDTRGYKKIYWAIDLHGVCLKSNYIPNKYEIINEDVIPTLQLISSLPESVIILWSSCYEEEQENILEFFDNLGEINVKYFNYNPQVGNTETGCFNEKFFFSVLLDDKAGFDPDTDWREIYEYLINKQW